MLLMCKESCSTSLISRQVLCFAAPVRAIGNKRIPQHNTAEITKQITPPLLDILPLDRANCHPIGHACYLIASERRTYAGYTTCVHHRLMQHNGLLQGGAKATRGHGPWHLIGVIFSPSFTRSTALSFEWHCKHERVPAAILRGAKQMAGGNLDKAIVDVRLAKLALALSHPKFADFQFHVAVHTEEALMLVRALLQLVPHFERRVRNRQYKRPALPPKTAAVEQGMHVGDGGGLGPKKKRAGPPAAVAGVKTQVESEQPSKHRAATSRRGKSRRTAKGVSNIEVLGLPERTTVSREKVPRAQQIASRARTAKQDKL